MLHGDVGRGHCTCTTPNFPSSVTSIPVSLSIFRASLFVAPATETIRSPLFSRPSLCAMQPFTTCFTYECVCVGEGKGENKIIATCIIAYIVHTIMYLQRLRAEPEVVPITTAAHRLLYTKFAIKQNQHLDVPVAIAPPDVSQFPLSCSYYYNYSTIIGRKYNTYSVTYIV